ncbi:MAG: hypothetical protein Kow0031_22790 [Anaerolineae bacterium]
MSTVIGLVKEEQQLVSLTARLEALGEGLSKMKVFRRPAEAEEILYKNAYTECHIWDCMGLGALAGLAVALPLALVITLFSCYSIGGCSPLAWGPGILVLLVAGAVIGASLGSYRGTSRLEKIERTYVDALNAGDKLVVVPVESGESAQRTASLLKAEHATAVKILNTD